MGEFSYPYVTVGGLIVAPDGEILLVKAVKWSGLYTVPGGKVELGETLEHAFQREIKEETNLEVVGIQFAQVQDCIFSKEFWQKKHFVMHDYIAQLAPGFSKSDVILNEESQEYIWVPPAKALQLPITRQLKVLIDWYLLSLKV